MLRARRESITLMVVLGSAALALACDQRGGRGRGDQPGHVAPAERGDHDRQRREIEQKDRRKRSRNDGSKQERRRRASSQSDQDDLDHLKLSRFISG